MAAAAVFIDANYYIAVLLHRDRWHAAALAANAKLEGTPLVTSEAVLFEVLNHMSKLGLHSRERAVELFHRLRSDRAIEVVGFSDELIQRALDLYAARGDKSCSLTDCVSMVICRDRGVTSVLTHDHNFEQEGFQILIKDDA